MSAGDSGARAAEVARASYGKLLATMASRTGDIMAAEDALADAFARALATWPERGIPPNPEAWLMTTAKNALVDHQRQMRRMDVTDTPPEPALPEGDPTGLPDQRLHLMFVCAHPAIDPGVRTPLMLQTVLGVEATDIARAYLMPGPTMAQRLVRAKRKIKEAGIAFRLPDGEELAPRMEAVLEAVYGAFSLDWLGETQPLADEALYLARVLVEVAPEDPEVLGLAALVTYIHARRLARVAEGVLVPLHQQDTAQWDAALIDEATALLERASDKGILGRFQLEAAIQSVHAARLKTGETDWRALCQLHTALMRLYPTIGAAVSRAVVIGFYAGPHAGLKAFDTIDAAAIDTFQPAWAARAHFLSESGQTDAALAAYATAIKQCTDPPLRRWLEAQRDTLIGTPH
ncbi:MAG: DUF6596 domain-containing protein [Pseudomonadota bacterium]